MAASLHDLKRAVVLRPAEAGPRYALAEALFAEGSWAEAAAQLERLLATQPADANARRLLARAYDRDQRPGETLRVLREGVTLQPDDPAPRDALAEFLVSQERFDDAAVQLLEAAQLRPADAHRWMALGEFLRRRLQWDAAVRYFERAVASAPGDAHVAATLAFAQEQRDLSRPERLVAEPASAAELLDSEGLLSGAATRAAAIAARRLVHGDVAGARKALVLAPAAERGEAAFALVKAEICFREGDPGRAKATLTTLLAQSPRMPAAHRRLGDLAWLAGDPATAAAHYGQAVALAPTDVTARAAWQRARQAAEAPRAPTGTNIGRIGVLTWTPYGGSVSELEAVFSPGPDEVACSGNAGEELREAASTVFWALRVIAASLGLGDALAGRRLHFHFDDSQTAKDGRSAGLPFALAAVSAALGRPLPEGLAATGEVTPNGAVRRIGGTHEKVVAAYLLGYRTVFVPRQNLVETRGLPPEVLGRMKIVFVDSIVEAVALALGPVPSEGS